MTGSGPGQAGVNTPVLRRRFDGDLAHLVGGPEVGTPVVFLHGWSDMADCWQGFARRLALDLPMHALDAPGHGYSALWPDVPFLQQLVDRAIAHVASLGRPAILVGHSMGAVQALYMAGNAPDLVAAVVLEDPPLATDLSRWQDPATFAAMAEQAARAAARPAAHSLARLRVEQPHWDEDEFEPMVRSTRLFDHESAAGFRIHAEGAEATLERVQCPALLLTGDVERGALVDAALARWAQEHNAGIAVHLVAVTDVVRAFILERA